MDAERTLIDVDALRAMLEAVTSRHEKLDDLSTEELLRRHRTLTAKRLGMGDDSSPAIKAAASRNVYAIEKILGARGADFEPLPAGRGGDALDHRLPGSFESGRRR